MRFRTLLICAAAVISVGTTSALVAATGADGTIGTAARAEQRAERTNPPVEPPPDRPRVFMAFHGMNRLATTPSFDAQWRFVQDNLDGFWGNNARISRAEIASLVRKVDTRQLSTESEFGGSSFHVETYAGLEREHPDIEFDREAITFYTDQPQHWDGDSIAAARQAVAVESQRQGTEPYRAVYTGWQPQNFYPQGEGSRPPIRPGSAAERALLDGDGTFVECPNDVCNGIVYEDGFFRAMRTARAEGQRFVWLASRPPGSPQSGWLAEFQTMYNRIEAEGLWRPGDIVVVIAYDGQYPLVPEAVNGQAPDTTTGLMYWALNQ